MGAKAKGTEEHGIGIEASWIVSAVEVGGHSQTSLGRGGAKEVENLLITVQRLGGPVLGNLGKQAMFDGIPFGSARRIVGYRHGEIEGVGELLLEFGLPDMATTTIAATGVGERDGNGESLPVSTSRRWNERRRRRYRERLRERRSRDGPTDRRRRKEWPHQWSQSGSRGR